MLGVHCAVYDDPLQLEYQLLDACASKIVLSTQRLTGSWKLVAAQRDCMSRRMGAFRALRDAFGAPEGIATSASVTRETDCIASGANDSEASTLVLTSRAITPSVAFTIEFCVEWSDALARVCSLVCFFAGGDILEPYMQALLSPPCAYHLGDPPAARAVHFAIAQRITRLDVERAGRAFVAGARAGAAHQVADRMLAERLRRIEGVGFSEASGWIYIEPADFTQWVRDNWSRDQQ